MADLDKLTDELAGKAALATGMSVAKRALQDALLTDEQREARDAEEARTKKSKRTKMIAYGVIGLLLLIGVVGLALTYWYWFLLAGIASLGVLYTRSRLRKRRGESGPAEKAEIEAVDADAPPRVEKVLARREVARPAAASEEEPPAPRAPRRPTAEEAEAEAEAVDAELAAMKARLRK